MIRELVLACAERTMARRPHDFAIGPADNPYMLRWYITPWSKYDRRGPAPWTSRWLPNLYLHLILHDDEDRALHDHPSHNVSWLLKNPYWEVLFLAQGYSMETTKVFRPQGTIISRSAQTAHRLVLAAGPVITLFFTGPVVRGWGFHCPKGWVPWREFVDVSNTGSVGKGCE